MTNEIYRLTLELYEERLFRRADNIISLEDMKKIMKESLDNAKTYGDFLDGMIIGAYKLGIEHGMDLDADRHI